MSNIITENNETKYLPNYFCSYSKIEKSITKTLGKEDGNKCYIEVELAGEFRFNTEYAIANITVPTGCKCVLQFGGLMCETSENSSFYGTSEGRSIPIVPYHTIKALIYDVNTDITVSWDIVKLDNPYKSNSKYYEDVDKTVIVVSDSNKDNFKKTYLTETKPYFKLIDTRRDTVDGIIDPYNFKWSFPIINATILAGISVKFNNINNSELNAVYIWYTNNINKPTIYMLKYNANTDSWINESWSQVLGKQCVLPFAVSPNGYQIMYDRPPNLPIPKNAEITTRLPKYVYLDEGVYDITSFKR